mmetsp:Transcript_58992/g.118444  ORF Transcript_58992/g.118444 Transcript_58992/m.118444 type:complete len:277 (+) Transcript_58992:47-877(+)
MDTFLPDASGGLSSSSEEEEDEENEDEEDTVLEKVLKDTVEKLFNLNDEYTNVIGQQKSVIGKLTADLDALNAEKNAKQLKEADYSIVPANTDGDHPILMAERVCRARIDGKAYFTVYILPIPVSNLSFTFKWHNVEHSLELCRGNQIDGVIRFDEVFTKADGRSKQYGAWYLVTQSFLHVKENDLLSKDCYLKKLKIDLEMSEKGAEDAEVEAADGGSKRGVGGGEGAASGNGEASGSTGVNADDAFLLSPLDMVVPTGCVGVGAGAEAPGFASV